MNIILLGAPGSGKGTQAEKLVEKLNYVQLSTGDMMRFAISKNTVLGIECKKYIDAGELVPDEITNSIVEEHLKGIVLNNLIFDGYPRTLNQAQYLNDVLEKLNSSIGKVFYLNVSQDVLVERLSGRLICPICKRSYHKITRKPKRLWYCDYDDIELITRSDDHLEQIKTRIETYDEQTLPLVEFYKQVYKLVQINATDLNTDEVYGLIKKEIDGNN